jgi:hypothetical protein
VRPQLEAGLEELPVESEAEPAEGEETVEVAAEGEEPPPDDGSSSEEFVPSL